MLEPDLLLYYVNSWPRSSLLKITLIEVEVITVNIRRTLPTVLGT